MGLASEPKGRGITVTIKYGKGYEQSWVVFHGLAEEIRDDIVSFFGMQRENVVNLTLSELVVNATSVAHGLGNLAAGLSATVVESRSMEPAAHMASAASVATSDAWAQAATTTPESPAAPSLFDDISRAPDVPALQRFWAENQAAFADPAVMDAWKARGRELSQS